MATYDLAHSSALHSAEHDPQTGKLTVQFKSGARWTYEGVPAALVSQMAAAKSVGGFFHAKIKGGGFKASQAK